MFVANKTIFNLSSSPMRSTKMCICTSYLSLYIVMDLKFSNYLGVHADKKGELFIWHVIILILGFGSYLKGVIPLDI